MPVTVGLTDRFIAELDAIEAYSVRQWGRRVADKYVDEIIAAIDRIESSPSILRLEPDLAPNLYFFRVKKHILVCDMRDDHATILGIVHASMDLTARLAEFEPRVVGEIEWQDRRFRNKSGD